MSKEEIAIRLIELFYSNREVFKKFCMGVIDLTQKYNAVLEILGGDVDDE